MPSYKQQFQAVLLFVLGRVAYILPATGRPLALHAKGYLAACLLARDGNRDLREWTEYHLWAGVDKIYLFDHNSTEPMFKEVHDYVTEGKVQYTYFSSAVNRIKNGRFADGLQGRVYGECFKQARGLYRWLMVTDLDEFLIVTDPKYNKSIPAVLREYEDAGAVVAHWLQLGSGGIQERGPGQEVLPTFTKCRPAPNEHLKGIANLEFASLGINAHTFKYKAGKTGVRAGDRAAVPGGLAALANPTSSPLLVYHYSKSVSEYASRTKTLGAGVSGATQKNIELYSLIDAKSNETCTAGAEAHARMTRRPTSLLMHVRDSSGEQEARR